MVATANVDFFIKNGLYVNGGLLSANQGIIKTHGNLTVGTGDGSTILVGNSTANIQANSTEFLFSTSGTVNAIFVPSSLTLQDATNTEILKSGYINFSNSTVTSNLGLAGLNIGANISITTTTFSVGNSTVNSVSNSTQDIIQDAANTATWKTGSINFANSTVASNLSISGIKIGSNVSVTTTTMTVGNSTVNSLANSIELLLQDTANTTTLVTSYLNIANSTVAVNVGLTGLNIGSNASLSTSTFFLGNSTINSVSNSTQQILQDAANTKIETTSYINFANSTVTANLSLTGLRVGANLGVNTSSVSIGNSTVNALSNSITLNFSNSTVTSNIGTGSLNLGSNISITTTTFFIGNSTVNSVSNSTQDLIQDAANTATMTTGYINFANATVTSNLSIGSVRLGANIIVNTTTMFLGNSTVNSVSNSTQDLIQDAANTATMTTGYLNFGNSTVTSNLSIGGLNVGANLSVTTTLFSFGNNTVNTQVNSTSVNTTNIVTTTMNGGQLAGFRNRIINGQTIIDQRNEGATVFPPTNTVTHAVDRFKLFCSNGSVLEGGRGTSIGGPSLSPSCVYAGVVTVNNNIGAANSALLYTTIEGPNIYDLLWGTASAKPVTLSFVALSTNAGTYPVTLRNSAANQSYISTFALAAATATKVTITIPGPTTSQWLTGEDQTGIYILWDLGSGSNSSNTTGSWLAGNYSRTSNSSNLIAQAINSTLDLTDIQLELGNTATPFEMRPISVEYELCQRYFEKSLNRGTPLATAATAGMVGSAFSQVASTGAYSYAISVPFRTIKCTAPTCNIYSASTATIGKIHDFTGGSDFTATPQNIGLKGFNVTSTLSGGTSYDIGFQWSADAELN